MCPRKPIAWLIERADRVRRRGGRPDTPERVRSAAAEARRARRLRVLGRRRPVASRAVDAAPNCRGSRPSTRPRVSAAADTRRRSSPRSHASCSPAAKRRLFLTTDVANPTSTRSTRASGSCPDRRSAVRLVDRVRPDADAFAALFRSAAADAGRRWGTWSRCPTRPRTTRCACFASRRRRADAVHRHRRRVRGHARARRQARRARARRRVLPDRARVAARGDAGAGDRRERRDGLVVRKAVELGVAAIQPLVTARSARLPAGERGDKRLAHWRQHRDRRVRAMRPQSRSRPSHVAPPTWLANGSPRGAGHRARARGADADRLPRRASRRTSTLLVGPEGGFDRATSSRRRTRGGLRGRASDRACCAPRPRGRGRAGRDQRAVGRFPMNARMPRVSRSPSARPAARPPQAGAAAAASRRLRVRRARAGRRGGGARRSRSARRMSVARGRRRPRAR